MQRREFLRSSCNTCLLAASGLLLLPALSGCGPGAWQVFNTEVKDGQLTVPLDSFAKGQMVLVKPKGWFFNIAVRKTGDNSYTALLLQCTHQANQLNPGSSNYTCSLHGSTFNLDGQVIKGPAEIPLRSFPVTVEKNQLIINTKA